MSTNLVRSMADTATASSSRTATYKANTKNSFENCLQGITKVHMEYFEPIANLTDKKLSETKCQTLACRAQIGQPQSQRLEVFIIGWCDVQGNLNRYVCNLFHLIS